MAFTKFASLEVLEVKSAPGRVRSASLSKFADFSEYRTDAGYMYVRVRAISSRTNRNGDGWPSSELAKSYRTFIGKPIYVDHHNHDPKRARGVIVDAALHVEDEKTSSLDSYYASAPSEHLPPTWIELLLEVDAKQFPKLAKAVINNDIDGVSMGANVEMSKCSHCGNEARSPEEFCKHIQSKGAYFDYYMPDGTKTSKKSYEDCYGVGFFEISFVFDPADDTALKMGDAIYAKKAAKIAAIHNEGLDPLDGFGNWEAKTADRNPPPQSDMTTAPEKVNTLRQEQICPVCGSNMEDGTCQTCNFTEPPEGFDNPDLQKAQKVDEEIHQQQAQEAAQGEQTPQSDVMSPPSGPSAPMPSGAMPATSKIAASMAVNSEKTAATSGGRINTQERPILPATRQLSDKPIGQKTVSEAKKPVESKTKETMSNNTKTADGATPQGEGVQAEKRVDVEGVGAVSGDPLSGIEHENVEKNTGDFTGPHTDTWSAGEGDSLGQHEPVTSESGDLFTVSSTECDHCEECSGEDGCTHHESKDHEASVRTADSANDTGGPIGEAASDKGSAKDGGPTWDKSDAGFPDHQPARVDLNAPLKEEVGEGTKTDPNEQYRSLKEDKDAVTKENANTLGGPIGVAVASAKTRLMKAMKVAETEVALGLREASAKFDRIAELEDASEEALDATLATLASVKTAGLKKTAAATKTSSATRMPSFAKSASFEIEAHSVADDEFGLF